MRCWLGVILLALFAAAGCGRSGTRPVGTAEMAKAGKLPDLSRPFNPAALSEVHNREPITIARQMARSAGGTWVVLSPKPLEEVKWEYSGPGTPGPQKVSDVLDAVRKAGSPINWENRDGYLSVYFGAKPEMDRMRAQPPQETVGVYFASESARAMLHAVSDFWKVSIEVDPDLLKRREALLTARRRMREESQEPDPNNPMAAYQAAATGGGPTMLEFKVVERVGEDEMLQRLARYLGGEGRFAGGGKWQFARLTDPAKVRGEIDRLKEIVVSKSATASAAFSSYAARSGTGGGAEEDPSPMILPLDEEAEEALDGLVMLGKPAVRTLADFLDPQKPPLAMAALRALAAMDLPEASADMLTFARDLRARATGHAAAHRAAMEGQIISVLGRNPNRAVAGLLRDIAQDPTASADARMKARLALVSKGCDLDSLMSDPAHGDVLAAERTFDLAWSRVEPPPVTAGRPRVPPGTPPALTPSAPVPVSPPPPVPDPEQGATRKQLRPLVTWDGPTGERWAAFLSPRYGNANDLWLAHGTAGHWDEFLFTGKQFERRNEYGGPSGQAKAAPCVLTVSGDAVSLKPTNMALVAEEKKLQAAFNNSRTMKPDERRKLEMRWSQVSSQLGSSMKAPITLSLAALRKDSDGDGLTDVVEARLGTDPTKADTDGDGAADARDRNPLAKPLKVPGDRALLLQATFSALFGGDPAPSPIVVALEPAQAQEFTGAQARVLCMSRAVYLQRARELGALRSLQFGGPKDADSTILPHDGPVFFNDEHTKAEIHFWIWSVQSSPYGRYGDRSGALGDVPTAMGMDYMARFERKQGSWRLVSLKPWKCDTYDKFGNEAQQRSYYSGPMVE